MTRVLQEAAGEQHERVESSRETRAEQATHAQTFYSVIFVARSGHPSVMHSHLPQMVAVASKAHPERAPVRLVGLSKACEERLSQSLGIPRVSCIGLREDAPNSKPLVDITREARQPEYRATKIRTIETTVGAKKQRVQGS